MKGPDTLPYRLANFQITNMRVSVANIRLPTGLAGSQYMVSVTMHAPPAGIEGQGAPDLMVTFTATMDTCLPIEWQHQCVKKAIMDLLEHEIEEKLYFNGARIYDPHKEG